MGAALEHADAGEACYRGCVIPCEPIQGVERCHTWGAGRTSRKPTVIRTYAAYTTRPPDRYRRPKPPFSMVANWPSFRLETTQNTESPFHGIQTWHVLRYVDMCTRRQVVKTKGPRDQGVPLVAAPASGSRT